MNIDSSRGKSYRVCNLSSSFDRTVKQSSSRAEPIHHASSVRPGISGNNKSTFVTMWPHTDDYGTAVAGRQSRRFGVCPSETGGTVGTDGYGSS